MVWIQFFFFAKRTHIFASSDAEKYQGYGVWKFSNVRRSIAKRWEQITTSMIPFESPTYWIRYNTVYLIVHWSFYQWKYNYVVGSSHFELKLCVYPQETIKRTSNFLELYTKIELLLETSWIVIFKIIIILVNK